MSSHSKILTTGVKYSLTNVKTKCQNERNRTGKEGHKRGPWYRIKIAELTAGIFA